MDCQLEEDAAIISFGHSIDYQSLEMQLDIFKKVLKLPKLIILNIQDLEYVDTPSLQLLLSFILTLNKKNIEWKWEGKASDNFVHCVELLGMQKFYNITFFSKGVLS